MEKHELILSIAKDIFLPGFKASDKTNRLGEIDEQFKAIVKTVSESYKTINDGLKD